jgi:hypothetical protein
MEGRALRALEPCVTELRPPLALRHTLDVPDGARPKVDRLLLKMPVRLGPMANKPPKAQAPDRRAAVYLSTR